MVKGYCHYHLCERNGEVEDCPHCKKHFCSEHINPIEPGSYHPEKSRVLINQIRLGHEKTHPCPDYVDYLEHQKKIQSHRWGKTLDRLTGRSNQKDLDEEEVVFQDNKKHEDEPYLYRYIPPEEQSRHPRKVQEKYSKEQVVFERESFVKSSFNKIKRRIKNYYHEFKFLLRHRPHRAYNNWHAFFFNVIWIVVLSIIFLIIYSNINKLNKIVIWFLPLGGALLIINLIFWIRYVIKLFKRVYYWFHGERNGIRYIIILILLLILWQAYQNRDTIFNPIIAFYDKTDFSAMLPIGISERIPEESVFSAKSVNSLKESVKEAVLPQPIDSKWVSSFMTEVNAERAKYGLQPMKESSDLNAIAYSRFNNMIKHPEISHYGAGAYNIGEVVFYPSGFTPKDYVKDIQDTAYLHWELLANPMFSYYGYYVGSGPTIQIYGSCSSTEIPGPNINVEDYFKERGCQTSWGTSTWLVIDMT